MIRTFIDRIIKRLQHFKSSLDNGLSTTAFTFPSTDCMHAHVHSDLMLRNSSESNRHGHSSFHLVHVRKSSAAIHDFDTSGGYRSYEEQGKDLDHRFLSNHLSMSPSVTLDEHKCLRPYFLIRPQSLLVLPNEAGKRRRLVERSIRCRRGLSSQIQVLLQWRSTSDHRLVAQ